MIAMTTSSSMRVKPTPARALLPNWASEISFPGGICCSALRANIGHLRWTVTEKSIPGITLKHSCI